MKKKIFTALLCSTLLFTASATVFADEKDDKIAELEAKVKEMQTMIDDLQSQLAKYTSGTEQDEYKIGDTWTVDVDR